MLLADQLLLFLFQTTASHAELVSAAHKVMAVILPLLSKNDPLLYDDHEMSGKVTVYGSRIQALVCGLTTGCATAAARQSFRAIDLACSSLLSTS